MMWTTLDLGILNGLQRVIVEAEVDDHVAMASLLLLCILYPLYYTFWDKPNPYHHVWFEVPQGKGTKDRKRIESSRNISVRLQDSKKDVAILWASQSGTAEGFANRLAKEYKSRFGRDAIAVDISDVEPESLADIPHSKLVIFIFSTYGDGDPSDNGSEFLRWLRSDPPQRFLNLRYAAFGLGNSNYKYYNRVIDIVVESLDLLGANAIQATGKADDSKGQTEDDFASWKQDLFLTFKEKLGFEEIFPAYEPMFCVLEDKSLDVIDLNLGKPVNTKVMKPGLVVSTIQPLDVREIRPLFSTPQKRGSIHIEIDITDYPEIKYTTGDHLAVWPCNPTSEVNQLLSVLQLEDRSKAPILINSLDSSVRNKIPSPTTLEAIFRYYIEICHPLCRETILQLATFAPSQGTKNRLLQLSDKTKLAEFCSTAYNTLACILRSVTAPDESWSAIPLSFILEMLPSLKPRYYSISSSSIVQPRSISITVSTSPINQNLEPVPGVMTNYFLDLGHHLNDKAEALYPAGQPGPMYNLSGPNHLLKSHRIFGQVCKSKFRLPVVASNPIVMIAAGSGIAPFRGFLQERARLSSIGRDVGRSMLFFGCRNEEEFLYQQDLSQLCAKSNLTEKHSMGRAFFLEPTVEVITAFSRQGEKKTYVQDRISEHKKAVCQLLLEQDASLYICGSARMARDVAQMLGECLKEQMSWDEKELKQWSEYMKKCKRWQEDVWK